MGHWPHQCAFAPNQHAAQHGKKTVWPKATPFIFVAALIARDSFPRATGRRGRPADQMCNNPPRI
jgi:hypothetical protein